jgi:hypothetical protein
MLNLTPVIARGKLDTLRKLFHGTDATLSLLKYARPGFKGYDILKAVPSGWHYSGGKEIDEPIILEIAESETVTAELLNEATMFGINGNVWIMVEGGRQAPTYPAKRIWKFSIKPSGEPVFR